jgi:hypothetical protein
MPAIFDRSSIQIVGAGSPISVGLACRVSIDPGCSSVGRRKTVSTIALAILVHCRAGNPVAMRCAAQLLLVGLAVGAILSRSAARSKTSSDSGQK